MADDADRANDQAQQLLEMHLRVRKPEMDRTGVCFNCEEPTPPGAAYCCPECREDAERIARALTLKGRTE